MASFKLIVLALTMTTMHLAEGTMMKSLQKRSLAALSLPDPHCKTGVISLKLDGKPQSCCAGYCGACNDYETCKSVNGQDSKNACCASNVYKMRCGNAPANVCLKTCSEAVPPCVMDKDMDDMSVSKVKSYAGVPPCNEIVPFVRDLHAESVMKGKTLGNLHASDSKLQEALAIMKSAQAKLQKDAKEADIPKEISTKYDATIKRSEKVMENVRNGISKVQELSETVGALKVGKEISHELKVKVTGEIDAAEKDRKEAEEVKRASQSLHQQVLEHVAKQADKHADKQADQYAAAQAAAADKEAAAAKAKKEAAEAAAADEKAAEAKAEAAKLKAAAEAAAAEAKKQEGEKKAAAAEAKAKAAAVEAKEKSEAAEAKAKASAAEAKAEAAKKKADAEAAAAEAKKQEEQKKAAEEASQKAAKKMCQSQLQGLPCGQEWAFVTDSKSNLVSIKKGPNTGSGKTEVHRLTAASNYKEFDLHTATALQITDDNWDFVMDSKDNLVAILKGPTTGSGKTEVHRLSAASNYLQFDLEVGTGLQITDENWAFTMDSKDNLVCVLKGPSGSGKTEVHRLTAASNYIDFNLHTATGLHYTNAASNEGEWDFAMDPQDDLVCILKGPKSGSGKTEVHKLTAASNYNEFNLHTSTALHYTDKGWAFAMSKNDVVGILRGPTSGTCMTEVHKLSGAANYGQFVFETGTGLDLSGATSCAR